MLSQGAIELYCAYDYFRKLAIYKTRYSPWTTAVILDSSGSQERIACLWIHLWSFDSLQDYTYIPLPLMAGLANRWQAPHKESYRSHHTRRRPTIRSCLRPLGKRSASIHGCTCWAWNPDRVDLGHHRTRSHDIWLHRG